MFNLKFSGATDRKHFYVAGAIVLIGTIVTLLLLFYGLPLPTAASEEAATIDTLIRWHLVVIAFLFALVIGVMIYALVVFRKREDDDSEGEHFEGNLRLELIWTFAPLILVFIFGYYGWWSLNKVTRTEPNEIVIDVRGAQWAWLFTTAEGVESSELVLPVNRPAVMKMYTMDVMHGFWVPEFRVKQDIVSTKDGTHNEVRFTPTLEGEWQVVCTVLCGTSHYSMKAKVTVVSQEEYAVWLDGELAKIEPSLASK